jgi:hypothetical protein
MSIVHKICGGPTPTFILKVRLLVVRSPQESMAWDTDEWWYTITTI